MGSLVNMLPKSLPVPYKPIARELDQRLMSTQTKKGYLASIKATETAFKPNMRFFDLVPLLINALARYEAYQMKIDRKALFSSEEEAIRLIATFAPETEDKSYVIARLRDIYDACFA